MRLDRFITLQLVQPVQRTLRSLRGQPAAAGSEWAIPILMYHSITDAPETGARPYYQVNTSPTVFREHLRFLAENGYKTISLSALVDRLSDGRSTSTSKIRSKDESKVVDGGGHPTSALDSKLVVITFDDGFRNFATHAFPALQKHGFTATMFLPTAFIHDERKSFKGTECLTWNEVRELRQAGVEFGSHTVNHPILVDLPPQRVRDELRQSRAELEQNLGEPISTFCYPFAYPQGHSRFAEAFSREVADAGYSCCVTTRVGRVRLADDPYCLKRLPVNGRDELQFLKAKLEGAYDWLELPQNAAKKVKALFCPRATPTEPAVLP